MRRIGHFERQCHVLAIPSDAVLAQWLLLYKSKMETTRQKTGLWGFKVRFENSPWEWAAPSLLMDADGMCVTQRIVEVRYHFSGRVMTAREFYRLHGPKED